MRKTKDIKKLQVLDEVYERIKTELARIYITSKGNKHINEVDAISEEQNVQKKKDEKRIKNVKMAKTIDILLAILKENGWGIFYKSQPMQSLEIQGDTPLLKINEVSDESISDAVYEKLSTLEKEGLKELWKEHIPTPSQDDSSQNEN